MQLQAKLKAIKCGAPKKPANRNRPQSRNPPTRPAGNANAARSHIIAEPPPRLQLHLSLKTPAQASLLGKATSAKNPPTSDQPYPPLTPEKADAQTLLSQSSQDPLAREKLHKNLPTAFFLSRTRKELAPALGRLCPPFTAGGIAHTHAQKNKQHKACQFAPLYQPRPTTFPPPHSTQRR